MLKLTYFWRFIEKFGEWSVAEPCKIKELPFIADIERFLDELEAAQQNIHGDSANLAQISDEDVHAEYMKRRYQFDNPPSA